MEGKEPCGRVLALVLSTAGCDVQPLSLDSEDQVIYTLCDNIRALPGSRKFRRDAFPSLQVV